MIDTFGGSLEKMGVSLVTANRRHIFSLLDSRFPGCLPKDLILSPYMDTQPWQATDRHRLQFQIKKNGLDIRF